MNSKRTSISLDLFKIPAITEKKAVSKDQTTSIRTTIFSLGLDPRVSNQQLSTPDLFLVEIMKDQLKQLFVRINWKIPKFDIDSGNVLGFNIYKKINSTINDEKLSLIEFSKLTQNLKRDSKFSEDRKGIQNVKKGSIDLNVLNTNLAQSKNFQQQSQFQTTKKDFEKIAFVDFSKFVNQQKEKTVFSEDFLNESVFYDDRTVAFGQQIEYFVSSVSSKMEETFQSDVVPVLVRDESSISPPDISAKQIDEFHVFLKIVFKKQDQINDVIVFRREIDNDVRFIKIGEITDVKNESVEFIDDKIGWGKEYDYLVFTKNIHEVLSPPAKFSFFCSTSIEKSHSNDLKKPVFNAEQQKNVAKITISPNDSKILFYKIDRRDLSINEKAFIVPSRNTDGYGGNGWSSNQIFYNRLDPKSVVFIDDTVLGNHVYQYRICGYDRFGNNSSHQYKTIEIIQGEILKSPINLQIEILREHPLRVKIKWEDENVYDAGEKVFFEIQRRKGHEDFGTFPLTENQFIIDETLSDDTIQFSVNKTEDTFKKIPNRKSEINILSQIKRSNGVLDFLKENFFYFYKVKIITNDGLSSPFSEEIKLLTSPELSSPIDLIVNDENPKQKPAVVFLSWNLEEDKSVPEFFVIQRKVDNINDSFITIGESYFDNEFLDREVSRGQNYVYRVKSVDSLGRETSFKEVRIGL